MLAEIGDKTFLMVMLMTGKMNPWVLWSLAVLAETLMNFVSVSIGSLFNMILPHKLIEILAILMFFGFGAKLVYGSTCRGRCDGGGENDDTSSSDSEMSEAKENVERLEKMQERREPLLPGTVAKKAKVWERNYYTLFMFLMMCTEWGDSSQFVTIGLAAQYGIFNIVLGGFLAFLISFTLAILIGNTLKNCCKERWLNLASGILFIAFGVKELLSVL